MPQDLISIAEFRRRWRDTNRMPETPVFRVTTEDSMTVEGRERTRRFCFSDGSVDRMTDTIDPKGWDLSSFNKNPVALWAHNSSEPPIGRASNVLVENERLMGDIEFMPAETYAFAETIFRMVDGKWLRAVSVGFLPTECDWANDDDRPWGMDFKRQELLEISICPIPANPNALQEARAKGIDTRPVVEWAEKVLDGGGSVVVPRKHLEALRRQALEAPSMRTRGQRPPRRDLSETDPAAGGVTVGNCGRPADKECGMLDPAECAIHGQGEVGIDGGEGDKSLRALIAAAVKSALKRGGTTGKRRRRRREAGEGAEAPPELPEDHDKSLRTAAMHFKSAEDYYDAGDEHHDEAMNLMDEAVGDLDNDDGPPLDHQETVRSAHARFKSADALYDLGDEHHETASDALDKCVKDLDGQEEKPPGGDNSTLSDEDKALLEAARATLEKHRAA